MEYIFILLAFGTGFFFSEYIKKAKDIIKVVPYNQPHKGKIKILKKAQPATYDEMRLQALEHKKPLLKRFYK